MAMRVSKALQVLYLTYREVGGISAMMSLTEFHRSGRSGEVNK